MDIFPRTDTPDGSKPDFKLFRYTPSLPAAIIAAVIFAILSCLHIWHLTKARAWYFIPFAVGGAFEIIGYAARTVSHKNQESVPAFSLQAILILVAPALFAASIYMILGRIIISLRAQHLSLIPVRWLTKVFICGDILSFSLQGAGGGIQASRTIEGYNRGEKIILAGLFVQIVVFGFFVITSGLFHLKCLKNPTPAARENAFPWKLDLKVLYAVSTIILVRSIFRVVEYLQGNAGFLVSHEILLYIFDAVLMAIVMVVFLIWYINHLQYKDGGQYILEPCVADDTNSS
ncbi:Rtm1p [Fusarium circinatum]|uniref:Rtm1p n=1 Tax=Fusarium circinatum TaxID=48490 RepID=A0A8H5TPF3_FUSCI|nr:Rtm1p [Fusarium circinatum]